MEVNLLFAAYAGFVGAIIMTLAMYLLKWFGQDLDIPFLIGTRFFDIDDRSKVYTFGILSHLFIGAGWGVLYVFLLTAMVVIPNWPAGILWGFAHGIFIGAMMGILADDHPYIGKSKPIKDPGILGSDWGVLMPYWILGLHVLFGVTTLSLYHWWVFG